MTDLKGHLESMGITFVSMFFFTFTSTIMAGDFTFSKEMVVSAIIAALAAATRSLFKVVYEISKSIVQSANNIDTTNI